MTNVVIKRKEINPAALHRKLKQEVKIRTTQHEEELRQAAPRCRQCQKQVRATHMYKRQGNICYTCYRMNARFANKIQSLLLDDRKDELTTEWSLIYGMYLAYLDAGGKVPEKIKRCLQAFDKVFVSNL